jgi:uncharacterized protein
MTTLTLDGLDDHYPAPAPRTLAKTLDHIDRHAARYIALSPFCVLASAGADGSVDASPRGGEAGFVKVRGRHELLLPDRLGNNRLDSFRNILSGAGEVSLIFFLPGIDETLRVVGRASLSIEPALLAAMSEFGKPPRAVLVIEVRESFLHCAKALMRSRLWDPDARVDRSVLPSMGEMLRDQTRMGEAETRADMLIRYKDQL